MTIQKEKVLINFKKARSLISKIIEKAMSAHKKDGIKENPSLDDILFKDLWSREFAKQLIDSKF